MSSLVTITPLDRKLLPFFLRSGLLLIQLSSRTSSNRNAVLLYNACELSLATVAYGIVDHVFTAWQTIGQGTWTTTPEDKTITGWSAVITATGLFTAMISGRMHPIGFITVVAIMAAFIDPVMIYWIQPNKSVMRDYDVRAVLRSYKNMGGCAIIHVCAGFVALLAFIFVGRLWVRRKDIDNHSPVPKSPMTCFLGYCLLIVGMVAMCMPNSSYETSHASDEYIDKILTNNIMAIAGGFSVVLFMRFSAEKLTLKFCTVLRCMKGAIAAMVTISSGVDMYTPLTALLLGTMGGAFYYFVARKLFRSPWEEGDYSNMIPIHLLCGLVSTLMPPIFGNPESFVIGGDATWSVLQQVSWQVIYKSSLLLSLFIIFLPVFMLLHCFGLNQKKCEDNNLESRQAAKKICVEGSLSGRQVLLSGKSRRMRVVPHREEAQDERQMIKELREKQKACLRYFNPRLADQTRL